MRVRVPGSTIADASRRPAAPATAMQLSSSTPCATTSSKNGRPLPAPIASPATAPSRIPFWMSTYSVPRPKQDAAREREERHLDVVREDLGGEVGLVVDGDAEVLRRRGRGCVTDWYALGTRPLAGPGSRHAQ